MIAASSTEPLDSTIREEQGPTDPRESAIRAAFDKLRAALDQLERAMLFALPTAAATASKTMPLVRRDVMKPREYAEYMRVNVRKVHGWIRGGMPHFLVEGRIRIRPAEADAWLGSKQAEFQKEEGKESEGKSVRTHKPKAAINDQTKVAANSSKKKVN